MKLPVLLLIYNRPKETQKILNYLVKIRIKKIFISIDGPKQTKKDKDSSKKVELILNKFRNKNIIINKLNKHYGCKKAVEKGISWFFNNVKKGIILEDDCIPSKSFFLFCEKMLNRYYNTQVKVISGNNFLKNEIKVNNHYYFSKFNHCWGWATWKEAWSIYDGDLKNWERFKSSKRWDNFFNNSTNKLYWEKIFDLSKKNYFDSWAYPWLYSIWYNRGFTIIPKYNLVKNVGLKGTHNTFYLKSDFKVKNLEKNYKHPAKMVFNEKADNYVMKNFFKPKNFLWPTRLLFLSKMLFLNPKIFIKVSIKKLKRNYIYG
jgi:hypothetical protein|tara:strand:- start:89 stop:1039 length:951 start_codon:yes stop_codon:yes gene_type:complete